MSLINPNPTEDEVYQRADACWKELDQYWDAHELNAESEANDPQRTWAPQFFELYLAHKPSDVALAALRTAAAMWANLEGGSRMFEEKLPQIDLDSEAVRILSDYIPMAFERDGRSTEGEALIERLLSQLADVNVEAGVWLKRARQAMWAEDAAAARAAVTHALALDADEAVLKRARAILNELENLNPGQLAPNFTRTGLDGATVDLTQLRGRVVLLDFWATWCGPCRGEFPHLRRVAEKFANAPFTLISISLDDDVDSAKQMIVKEKLTWTHIFEGGWGESGLAPLYNIMGIPQCYLLNQEGRIHAKGLRGHDLDKAIGELMGLSGSYKSFHSV